MALDVAAYREALIAKAALRYPKFTTNLQWMRDLYFQPWAQLASYPDQTAAENAMWAQLDLFEGDAYFAFIKSHDNGYALFAYMRNGNNLAYLIHPPPPDTRYAPANDEVQTSFLNQGLDLYGNPMLPFHQNEGAAHWASHASHPPFNSYDVPPETARWLLLNNLIPGGNDRYIWEPFRGKTIAQAVLIIEDVNHPGSHA